MNTLTPQRIIVVACNLQTIFLNSKRTLKNNYIMESKIEISALKYFLHNHYDDVNEGIAFGIILRLVEKHNLSITDLTDAMSYNFASRDIHQLINNIIEIAEVNTFLNEKLDVANE